MPRCRDQLLPSPTRGLVCDLGRRWSTDNLLRPVREDGKLWQTSSLGGLCSRRRMTLEEAGRLPQVLARVGASHGITDLTCKLRFYDDWAPEYDQLQARGFLQVQGVDGSPEMLKQARARGLYHHLSLCTLGQEPLPNPEGTFDAVIIVGALSEGQVPCSAIPELLRVTKPGGLVCLTTRTNTSNLPYKEALEATLDSLEQAGAWERLVTQPVDHWELATSEQETGLGACANDGFISGIIYLYRKQGTR
ncbi:methyltransferase-like protein 27 isoform X2 [Mastomys coucha]|uniref:methyltransferase-like protein 27 isoform X2 n=1 Tax=Mastomys coucha TaxID=35658 RepID=UPI0012614443|nr:methyltransferase-like protein 27 isoform X2 [Mastomys coucha]